MHMLTPIKGYGRNECSEHLDTTLLDICRALEKENAELRKALVEGEEKWSKAEDQVSKSSLIPQYRAAIVKLVTLCFSYS